MLRRLLLPLDKMGFWSLNKVITEASRHWSRYAREKKRLTRAVMLEAMAQMKPVRRPVWIYFAWTTKDLRMDPDNVVAIAQKTILDGLVAAGILEDDRRKQILGLVHLFLPVDKKNPHVLVTLTETPPWHIQEIDVV